LLITDGTCRADRKQVLKIISGKQRGKYSFCHWRPTDIFITDKNNSDAHGKPFFYALITK
jgi:hypothetical protein